MKHSWKAAMPCLAILLTLALAVEYMGCTKSEPPLAPYNPGVVTLTPMAVEGGTYAPRISWNGSYVTALGINRGPKAIVDTSLNWLIYAAGDGLQYPEKYGTLPAGAQDLTVSSGGKPTTSLVEDQEYTFWIARSDAWAAIDANRGKVLVADSTATATSRVSGDSLFLSSRSFASKINPIDVYINIRNVKSVGRLTGDLGYIHVIQTDTSNAPIITFKIAQQDTVPPDTLLADIGICTGLAYNASSIVWEALAVDSSSGKPVYWTKDVIASPVIAGQKIPGTVEFTALPPGGLPRHSDYYIWIANKNWNQTNRSRSTWNYASATFRGE